MLPRQAIEAVNAVTKSAPSMTRMTVLVANRPTYSVMKAATERSTSSGTTRLPSRTGSTARGCSARRTSRAVLRAMISQRTTLMPPPAEPALPPMNMTTTSTACARCGHWAKSADA